MEMDRRLWVWEILRRARARAEALTSGEGGSPKMKNLIKAPMSTTTESWPSRKPWVKDRLEQISHCVFLC